MILIGLALTVLVLAFIGYPLLRPAEGAAVCPIAKDDYELPDLEKEKDVVFSTLNEIEYDYQMNKLSGQDYNELKNEYTQKAVLLLKEEDSEAGEVYGAIEREVEAELEAEIKDEIAQVPGEATIEFCYHCGERLLSPNQQFCHRCGGKLGKQV